MKPDSRNTNPSTSLAELRDFLDRKIDKRGEALSLIKREKARLKECKEKVGSVLQAQSHLQEIAKRIQTKAHRQVASVVSKCLSSVFKEPYELHIEFERKRGRTEAKFVYLRDGKRFSPRVCSGGVREVAGLALRLACLVLTLPPARKLLVLDEPFPGISEANAEKITMLINTLSKELGIQFVLVTHNQALAVGKTIQF